ncbi:helix-loop-helix DNA-binding domain-containing protein [Aspergillus ambiguus]|uniref:phosphate-sensing transcription factor PHO4 n=1 Tax=Aspergillus ambiguus TaxID=176160 RepID=UPI003CCD098C
MDQDQSLSWSDIPSTGEEDFSHFLEFPMHFADLEAQQQHHQQQQQQQHPPASTPSTMESNPISYNRLMGDFSVDPAYSAAPMTPAYYTQKQPPSQSHSHSHHQPTSQPYIPHSQPIIPPTPNSIELQGNAATYPQRVDDSHEMYDRYARMNEEQALYTPLVSPAMTPLESQFRLPEYTIPGEYSFTPLTSPALEAQNSHSNGFPFHQPPMSDLGFVPSPVDNAIPASSAPSSPGVMRRHRRRPSTTKPFSSRAKKQQSPSVRPQTRKKSLLNINSDEILTGLSQDQAASKPKHPSTSNLRYGSNESSGQDSVSPEPLSEPLMPPPALPPARKSPAIAPQTAQSQNNEPATPAMLMRIQRSQPTPPTPTSQPTANIAPALSEPHDDVMEDVVLPEAATPTTHLSRPQVSRIDTTLRTNNSSSPAITPGSATPAVDPKSAPAPSPRTVAMPSPSGPVGKKSETPKLGPIGRKRQSLSSAQPSPNLRPKISPSIQPLVRGDGMSSETSALYLASKSNYQHILDGTLLPGVSYPETLAENLSSKRTNHKLAEQGRRNRINNALKEIESLIPPAFVQLKNAKEAGNTPKTGEKEKEKAGNQQISKASTVEMAIDYIRALQKELAETKTKLDSAEARLADPSAKTASEPKNPGNGPAGESSETGSTAEAHTNGSTIETS